MCNSSCSCIHNSAKAVQLMRMPPSPCLCVVQVLGGELFDSLASFSQQSLSLLDSQLAELEDMLSYCGDVLACGEACHCLMHWRSNSLLSFSVWWLTNNFYGWTTHALKLTLHVSCLICPHAMSHR